VRNSRLKSKTVIPVFGRRNAIRELRFPPKTRTFKILCDHSETFYSFVVKNIPQSDSKKKFKSEDYRPVDLGKETFSREAAKSQRNFNTE
jgi:hypothetical protein